MKLTQNNGANAQSANSENASTDNSSSNKSNGDDDVIDAEYTKE